MNYIPRIDLNSRRNKGCVCFEGVEESKYIFIQSDVASMTTALNIYF